MASTGKSKLPLIVAALVGILLVAGVRMFMQSGSDSAQPGASGSPKPGVSASADPACRNITVVASSEKAALLRDLAGEYNAARREINGTCAGVTVVSKASGGAADALGRGWNEEVDGPRPDVWSPASSSWAALTTFRLQSTDKPNLIPKTSPSIAQSPLVIAMPRPMAVALGWPDKALGWGDLARLAKDPKGWGAFGHPEWGRFKLGKTNPHFSTSGLNATIGSYFAATGVSSDLTLKDVADPATQKFVKSVESTVVHYGDTTLTFLSNLKKADAAGRGLTYVSAVTVEEKSVWDYNQGNPSGDPATFGTSPKPEIPLVAVYPKEGTLVSDNPWIVLDAPWVDPGKKAVAADFLSYLTSEDAQKRFGDAAFRTADGKMGEVLRTGPAFLPDQPKTVLSPPSPAVLAGIEASWDRLRKPARVLMVLDVSGSMGESASVGGKSKMNLAREAASRAVELFAPTDQVGLWIFSTGQGSNNEPWQELAPIAPLDVKGLQSKIAGLVPDGGTGLYATIRAAEKTMSSNIETDKINAVVVLTDGRNEFPDDDNIGTLLDALGGESLDTSVRVFTIGYGSGADMDALRRISEASSAAAYDATDPSSIEKVLASVVSNF